MGPFAQEHFVTESVIPRRRRTWYRRRLRRQRFFAVSVLVAVIAFVCWQNIDRVFRASHRASDRVSLNSSGSFPAHSNLRQDLFSSSQHGSKHVRYVDRIPGVYPYSVVPGGIRTPLALREAAAHDRAISKHYAHFDFNRAHLIRVAEPREVYVSYRIRDTIFWTHKKIRLPVGEMLLTDGKITARAKCGNQISEAAKPDVSDQEPEEDILDQPVALVGLAPPLPFRPGVNLPPGQALAPPLNGGGFIFPYASFGGAPVSGCQLKDGKLTDCNTHHKKPVAPEPATIALFVSGLGMVAWRYRKQTMLA